MISRLVAVLLIVAMAGQIALGARSPHPPEFEVVLEYRGDTSVIETMASREDCLKVLDELPADTAYARFYCHDLSL